MRNRIFFLAPLVIFLGVAGYFLVGLQMATTKGSRFIPAAMVNKPVPQFDLPSFNASFPPLKTADMEGEPQVLNFFASWCIPCLAEHPLITRLAREEGVTVNGIAYSDTPANIEKWLNKHGNPYARVGVDQTRRIGIDWGVSGVPETYVVDGKGMIVYKHGGPLQARHLNDEILPLIKELKGS